MKYLIAAALLMMSPSDMANFKKLAAKDMKSSVLLHMKGNETDRNGETRKIMAGCSGTFIDPTHILTAAHCFIGYQVTNVWARGSEEVLGYPVKIVAIDGPDDLALVEAPFQHPAVKLGPMPDVGEEVLNIGSPLAFEFVASQGIVSCLYIKVPQFKASYLMTTAMINPGSSGGGVFDHKGRLIGVNTMTVGLFGWQGITMAVDIETIHKFLVEHHYAYDNRFQKA